MSVVKVPIRINPRILGIVGSEVLHNLNYTVPAISSYPTGPVRSRQGFDAYFNTAIHQVVLQSSKQAFTGIRVIGSTQLVDRHVIVWFYSQ
jgi:hypothetical protein